MQRSLNSLLVIIVGLLIVGGGVAYGISRVGLSTLAALITLGVAPGAVAVMFLGRIRRPGRTLERMLHNLNHPKKS